jgi:hypothetical protein
MIFIGKNLNREELVLPHMHHASLRIFSVLRAMLVRAICSDGKLRGMYVQTRVKCCIAMKYEILVKKIPEFFLLLFTAIILRTGAHRPTFAASTVLTQRDVAESLIHQGGGYSFLRRGNLRRLRLGWLTVVQPQARAAGTVVRRRRAVLARLPALQASPLACRSFCPSGLKL